MALPLLTLSQVSRFLSVSEETARQYVRAGWLPAMRVGKMLRFDPEAVKAALQRRRIGKEGERP